MEVYKRILPDELIFVPGTCKSVGYAGLALLGNLGLMIHNHGVASDSILVMQVVLAVGRFIMTDGTTPHKDL